MANSLTVSWIPYRARSTRCEQDEIEEAVLAHPLMVRYWKKPGQSAITPLYHPAISAMYGHY